MGARTQSGRVVRRLRWFSPRDDCNVIKDVELSMLQADDLVKRWAQQSLKTTSELRRIIQIHPRSSLKPTRAVQRVRGRERERERGKVSVFIDTSTRGRRMSVEEGQPRVPRLTSRSTWMSAPLSLAAPNASTCKTTQSKHT